MYTRGAGRFLDRYLANEVLGSEDLVYQSPNTMDVLVTDLDEDRPRFSKEIARNRQPIPQIRQIGVNPVSPRITESSNLLWVTRDVLDLAVFYVPARRGPLKVRIELDPVWWVDVAEPVNDNGTLYGIN